jgi:hypothetical protein
MGQDDEAVANQTHVVKRLRRRVTVTLQQTLLIKKESVREDFRPDERPEVPP